MIKLLIEQGRLMITNESKELFGWRHRTFFNISLGFEIDEEFSRYSFSDRNQFQDILKEVVDYLAGGGFEYDVDQAVKELIEKNATQATEFESDVHNLSKPLSFQKSTLFKRELLPYQIKGV